MQPFIVTVNIALNLNGLDTLGLQLGGSRGANWTKDIVKHNSIIL